MEVKLIDVTPNAEAKIAYCARVSSPNQDNPEYEKLLRYCIKHDHWCYDDKTEVLTEKGFVLFKNLSFEDKVAAYSVKSQSIKFEHPLDIYCGNYSGTLIGFETFLSDLMVTPNHRMLGVHRKQLKEGKEYKDFVDLAENMIDRTFAIRSCVPKNTFSRVTVPCLDSDLFLEFIGFFIGDGSCKGTNKYPTFHLKLERKISYLKELCHKLGIEVYERNDKSVFVVKIDGFKDYALSSLYAEGGGKTIPDNLLMMSQNQFSYLLNGLMESDGYQSSRKTDTMQYTTTSDLLADKIQILAVLNGFSCNNSQRKRSDGYYNRELFINKKQYAWVDKHRVSKFGLPAYHKYTGNVYCCSVSTGMLVVRRNNKVSICGNSVFEMADMTVEITTSRAIAAQILRHKSFSFQEWSQRYAEVMDYVPCEARRQDDKNRQNSIDDLDDDVKQWFEDAQNESWFQSYNRYQVALQMGIAKECARFLLPLNTQTRLYMKGSVRSWIHYIQVRDGEDTQKEHRAIAKAIKSIFREQFPVISGALEW